MSINDKQVVSYSWDCGLAILDSKSSLVKIANNTGLDPFTSFNEVKVRQKSITIKSERKIPMKSKDMLAGSEDAAGDMWGMF